MEVAERLAALAKKVESQRSTIETEEATKNAFIMPFIATVLGYDVFNPHEVTPEFTADVGVKKGEKIDYAIMHGGAVQMLIECKHIGSPLKLEHASQLFRYFAVTNARIAVLTNGQIYEFYTDLDQPNRMDEKPFLVLDVLDVDSVLIPELEKLTKDIFDLDSIINAAGELKYIGQLKRLIAAEFKEPSVEYVRYFATKVYEGQFNQKAREQFIPLVKKAGRQFLTDQVNARLSTALGAGSGEDAAEANQAELTSQAAAENELSDAEGDDIVTTMEELEGFQIIRAIVCEHLAPVRVVYRDAKSYCAILVDDNNRKPLARLHFNRKQKYLGLFDENKKETRERIENLVDIYQYADRLRSLARSYT